MLTTSVSRTKRADGLLPAEGVVATTPSAQLSQISNRQAGWQGHCQTDTESRTENTPSEFNRLTALFVITGLDPVNQNRALGKDCLDCRIKSGNDDMGMLSSKLMIAQEAFPA